MFLFKNVLCTFCKNCIFMMRRFTKNSIEFMADPNPYDDNFGFGMSLIWDISNNDKLLYNLKEIKYYYLFSPQL